VDYAEARENYYSHSGSASIVSRQLALAGLALIWILSGGGTSAPSEIEIRGRLAAPLVLFVLGLGFDLLQYVYLALAWRLFTRRTELRLKAANPTGWREDQFQAPPMLNRPGEVLMILKLLTVVTAYVWFGQAVATQLL